MGFVSDCRYLRENEEPEDEKLSKERKYDVELYRASSPLSVGSYKSYKLLLVTVIQNLKYVVNPDVYYGNIHEFNQ